MQGQAAEVSLADRQQQKNAATANTLRVRNWRPRYALAPSWTPRAIACIFGVPSFAASTSRRKIMAITSAIKAMTPTTATNVRLTPDKLIGSHFQGNWK